MAAKILVESFYDNTIQSSMTSTDTSVNVDVAPANDVDYAVLENGEANQEIIKWTAKAGLTLSGLLRGLSYTATTDTEVAGNKKSHGINDTIQITNVHYIINDKVSNAAAETIVGQKTFSSAVIQSVAAAGATELIRYGEAVKNTGNETVAGVKTFSSIPIGPNSDPTTANELVRKSYVDARPATRLSFTTYILGEDVLIRDALSSESPSNAQGGSDASFGKATASGGVKQAQSFIAGSVPAAFSMTVSLKKVASPTDNITVEIQTDNAGDPSGTPVTNGTSNTVDGSTLTGSYTDQAFTWASVPTLVAGTKYWFVLTRSTAGDDTNYYQVQYSSVNAFRAGAAKVFTTVWTTNTGVNDDLCFVVTGMNATAVKSIYNSYNSNRGYLGHVGFAVAAGSAGATIESQNAGVMTGFTGLTKNSNYHISATAGQIVVTVRNPVVGVANETTSLVIGRNYINETVEANITTLTDDSDASQLHWHKVGIIQGTRDITAASGAVTYAHGLAVVPRYIEIHGYVKVTSSSGGINFMSSSGFSDGAGTNKCTFHPGNISGVGGNDASNCIRIATYDTDTDSRIQFAVATFDATNVTLTWTLSENATPTQTGTAGFTILVHA